MALEETFERGIQANHSYIDIIGMNTNWDDLNCPICLEFPHNSVLLLCSSYGKGCHPFVCDTDHLHSNCLDRFRNANGISSPVTPVEIPSTDTESKFSDKDCRPVCPLCRGEVTGWVVVKEARVLLDARKRCCDEEQCKFMGSYLELRKHAQLEHPLSCPSKIDSARQLDWENMQQSSEMIDVLSTIHSEVPNGVVLGDYVIDYGDDFDDFHRYARNWWSSCVLYQVFDNFRNSRNRRRSRVIDSRRGSRRSSYSISNSDEGSVASVEFAEYRLHESGDYYSTPVSSSGSNSGHPSSRRHRFRINDN